MGERESTALEELIIVKIRIILISLMMASAHFALVGCDMGTYQQRIEQRENILRYPPEEEAAEGENADV